VPADRLNSRMHGGTVVARSAARSVGADARMRARTGRSQAALVTRPGGQARRSRDRGPELELDGRPWQAAGLLLARRQPTGPRSVLTPMPVGAPGSVPRSAAPTAEPVTPVRCGGATSRTTWGQPLVGGGATIWHTCGANGWRGAARSALEPHGAPRAVAPVPPGSAPNGSGSVGGRVRRPAAGLPAARPARRRCAPADLPVQVGRPRSVDAGGESEDRPPLPVAIDAWHCPGRVSGLPSADAPPRARARPGMPARPRERQPRLPRCSSYSARVEFTCPRLRAGPRSARRGRASRRSPRPPDARPPYGSGAARSRYQSSAGLARRCPRLPRRPPPMPPLRLLLAALSPARAASGPPSSRAPDPPLATASTPPRPPANDQDPDPSHLLHPGRRIRCDERGSS